MGTEYQVILCINREGKGKLWVLVLNKETFRLWTFQLEMNEIESFCY